MEQRSSFAAQTSIAQLCEIMNSMQLGVGINLRHKQKFVVLPKILNLHLNKAAQMKNIKRALH
jgi:hypothetical protein